MENEDLYNSLMPRVGELYQQGKYDEAIPLAEKALNLSQKIWGSLHPNIALSLNSLAAIYRSLGEYTKAEVLYQNALDMAQILYPGDHPYVAGSLNSLALLYDNQGKLTEAECFYKKALAMYQRLFQGNNFGKAIILQNLGQLYDTQGKYIEAEPLLKEALAMIQSLYPGNHPSIIISLNNLASLYNNQGKYIEAEKFYKQALTMAQILYPENHPDVAISLNNLGAVYNNQGKYTEAEIFIEQALKIYKIFLPDDHPAVAMSLNNLAFLYCSQGNYKEAEKFYSQVLAIRQQLYQGNHPDLAMSLNNLASVYDNQGKYTEAEHLYQKSLTMHQRLFPSGHYHVVMILNNLALLYSNQGNNIKAEKFHKQALKMSQSLFLEIDPRLAQTINNLGVFYNNQGEYTKAETWLKLALKMSQRLHQGDHPDVATNLNNLAQLYNSQEKYTEAEDLCKQTLDMRQRLFSKLHPHVALSLNNLAFIYHSQRNYTEAEPLYQKSLNISQSLFPQGHPRIIDSLINLAFLYINTYRHQLALHFCKQATEVEHRLISQEFVGSSENDRMRFLEIIRTTQYNLLSLVYQYYYPLEASAEKSNAIHIALDVVLKRKALSNAASAAISAAIYSNRYPENIQAAFQQWRSLWQQIVNLQSSLYLPENLSRLEANKNLLNDLHQQVEKLEKDITKEVPEVRLENQLVDRETIASELPENSTLIEFVYFSVYDFVNRQWKKARYAAFILPAKQPNQIQMFDLGEADKIDELINKMRKAVTELNLKDMGVSVGNFHPQRELSLENLLIELSNTIFKPLENHLQGEQLFICPDNALTLIPFDILPLNAENNQLLIDKYNITYLTAARDLLRYKYNPNRPASESLVIADPNFDLSVDSSPTIPNNDNLSTSKIYVKEEGVSIKLDSLATEIIEGLDNENKRPFLPVPEIAEIAKVAANKFNVQPLLQNHALKSYLTNGKCPQILVLGTHGFFLTQKFVPKNLLEPEQFGERGLLRFQQMQTTENSLFRSGFALAGANTWLLGGEIPTEAGEGIVFAQDVAGFDLWANKIILLIACQTAVGDVTAGEGVKGLRSAFTAAGARLLIMSLWSVPVKPSILLMNRFFANMDNKKLPAQIALKEAQNYIRTMTRNELESLPIGQEILQELQLKIAPVLQRNPELAKTWKMSEYPLQHPYFWGAWVCVGRELKEEENQ